MGELGFSYLQAPLVDRLVYEAFVRRTLDGARESCLKYWIPAVTDDDERARLRVRVKDAREAWPTTRSIPSYVRSFMI